MDLFSPAVVRWAGRGVVDPVSEVLGDYCYSPLRVCVPVGGPVSRFFPRFVVVGMAQFLWGGCVVHKMRQLASRVPLWFGTLVRDGVGRVVAVRFEARFVSVWPGDFTPIIAGSH